MLGREGAAGLTVRGVAEEAGVPVAAMTYYFPSKEELLAETLRAAAAADVEELRAAAQLAATDPESLAEAIADLFLEQLSRRRSLLLAQFELSLQAARRPELRAAHREWSTAYRLLVEPLLRSIGSRDPYGDARLLCNTVDGLLLDQLAAPEERFEVDVLRPSLLRLLQAFAAPGQQEDGFE